MLTWFSPSPTTSLTILLTLQCNYIILPNRKNVNSKGEFFMPDIQTYPYDNDFMIFDGVTGQCVITEKALLSRGTDIRARLVAASSQCRILSSVLPFRGICGIYSVYAVIGPSREAALPIFRLTIFRIQRHGFHQSSRPPILLSFPLFGRI